MTMTSLRSWWEDELTGQDRTMLMKEINYDGWKGTTEERHKKLIEMYKVWDKKMKGGSEIEFDEDYQQCEFCNKFFKDLGKHKDRVHGGKEQQKITALTGGKDGM